MNHTDPIDYSWSDRDVAKALGVSKPQIGILLRRERACGPGELDLRLAAPIMVGNRRRWNPNIVLRLIEETRNS